MPCKEFAVRVTYRGPHDGVELPMLHRVVVARGQTVEVDDELGARLIEQRTWDADPDDIAAWVGDDVERARRLLVAEQTGAGRDEVLAHLEQIANPSKATEAAEVGKAADAVPAGTADEVLAWVGDDPARAARALEAERSGRNRAGLAAQLERLSTSTPSTKED
jgi:hypothetical protein